MAIKVEEVIDVREKLRGIAARFANQKLNGAFNKWLEYASNAAEEKAKLRAAVARLLHGSATRVPPRVGGIHRGAISTGGRVPKGGCEDLHARRRGRVRALARVCRRADAPPRDLPQGDVANAQLRVKAGAFDGWCVFVEKRRRERETYDRVVQLPKRRLARFGWLNWREAFHQRQQLRRAMRIMRNGVAFRALRMWRDNVDEALEHRALATRAFGFLRNRTVAGAFNRWKEFREECVELREKMLRVAARISQRVRSPGRLLDGRIWWRRRARCGRCSSARRTCFGIGA